MTIAKSDRLSYYVLLSIAGHILLFSMFLFKAILMPAEPILLSQAIRVDVVDLPDKEVAKPQPPPEPVAKPAPVVESKPKTKPQPAPVAPKKPTKQSQESAINKLKAMEAIENLKEEEAKQKERANKPAPPIKGNIVNAGSSLTGLTKIDFDRYFADVETQVRKNWHLPRWLDDLNLKAQISVKIDSDGMILSKEFIHKSGHDAFDNYVLTTLDHSAPFPKPPERLLNILKYQGIIFNFP